MKPVEPKPPAKERISAFMERNKNPKNWFKKQDKKGLAVIDTANMAGISAGELACAVRKKEDEEAERERKRIAKKKERR